MDNINLDIIPVGKIKGEFEVPHYQRGYRWKEEVKVLLVDIDNIPENTNYCLQPIVVKNKSKDENEKKYELIDGQQRLTTIYLIYKYLKYLKDPHQTTDNDFTINYTIRENSGKYLEEIDYNNLEKDNSYIDFYFFNEATKIIKDCFANKSSQEKMEIFSKLNKNIHVIWYEVASNEESESLFKRLNIGRIPLTNSELVKALFLKRNNMIDDYKQHVIASEWDNIEKELHIDDDNFWKFITNEDPSEYPTRIEKILKLKANLKENENNDKYAIFYHFEKEIKNVENKHDIWIEIKRYYQRLKEWYENRNLYHKIGFLIASDAINLPELVIESNKQTKKEFEKGLDIKIAESIDIKKSFKDLSYETDYDYICKLLLLFNIETIRKNQDKNVRFPFNMHKNGKWTLEHIHAQESEGMNKKEHWQEWLKLHQKSLIDIDKNENKILIDEIEKVKESDKLTKEIFEGLYLKVIKKLSENEGADVNYIHTLSNLALLQSGDNSALNNSTFDVKRNRIIEMDKSYSYIPVCTRMVFLKYYTDSEFNQIHFWGKADRDGYIKEMNKILSDYLVLIEKEIIL